MESLYRLVPRKKSQHLDQNRTRNVRASCLIVHLHGIEIFMRGGLYEKKIIQWDCNAHTFVYVKVMPKLPSSHALLGVDVNFAKRLNMTLVGF